MKMKLLFAVSCVALFCSGCNPIEEGIASAIETLVLNSFSDIWNSVVTNVAG